MLYVGMDVHVRNSYLIVTDEAGQVLRKGRIVNDAPSLAAFLDAAVATSQGMLRGAAAEGTVRRASAGEDGTRRASRRPSADAAGPGSVLVGEGRPAMRVCLESTTNSRAIHRRVMRYGAQSGVAVKAEVLDARQLRVIASSVAKTDALDAATIAALSRSNLRLPVCYMPDDEVFSLREHLRSRVDWVRIRTMVKNRVHAALHRRGILTPATGLFTRSGREFLLQLQKVQSMEMDASGRSIVSQLVACVDMLDGEISGSTRALRALAQNGRWRSSVELLRTMPGIGLITALTILAELGDLERFRKRSSVSNYAGLVPVIRESNEKSFRGGITHRGSCHLRLVMVEAAWVSMRRVPKYRSLYERVRGKKCSGTAVVAVAREMLEDAFTMLRKGEAFRYEASSLLVKRESIALSEQAGCSLT